MEPSQLETVQLDLSAAGTDQAVLALPVETLEVETPGPELQAFLAEQQEPQASPVGQTVGIQIGPGPSQAETRPESSWEGHGLFWFRWSL